MKNKTCSECNEIKPATLDFFHRQKKGKYGLKSKCKECVKKYDKEYRENNQEKIRERRKEYYENNKEKTKEQLKKYLKNNKEKIKEYQREYQKEYYQNNQEHLKEYMKQYQKNNPEKMREYCARYYAQVQCATPAWYEQEKEQIQEFYKNSTRIVQREWR